MKRIVKEIVDNLVGELSSWEEVDVLTMAKIPDEDLLSPYFFISIDVYYRRTIRGAQERESSFEDAVLFESSYFGAKDRFLIGDVPVIIEYKRIERMEALLHRTKRVHFGSRDSGTHLFYRIVENEVLFSRSDWLDSIRERLNSLPDEFWSSLRKTFWSGLENQLGDLGAAVIEGDRFFFLRSLSGYLNTLCSLLFIINRKFDPSGRRIQQDLQKLSTLPEGFGGSFDVLISEDEELSPQRKMEVAKLVTRSLIPLV